MRKADVLFLGFLVTVAVAAITLIAMSVSAEEEARGKFIKSCEAAQGIIKVENSGTIYCQVNGVRVADFE